MKQKLSDKQIDETINAFESSRNTLEASIKLGITRTTVYQRMHNHRLVLKEGKVTKSPKLIQREIKSNMSLSARPPLDCSTSNQDEDNPSFSLNVKLFEDSRFV